MFQPFFVSKNLRCPEIAPGNPWDFAPDAPALEAVRGMPKLRRRQWSLDPDTEWNVYSAIRGIAPNLRISGSNPAAGCVGLVADYDMKSSLDNILSYLNQIKPEFVPNFIEVSLGRKARLVWCFPREILVVDSASCQHLIETFFKKLAVPTLLPGYDAKSSTPTEMWTNGGEWYEVKQEPMPWDLVFGIAVDASKTSDFGKSDIPLEVIAAEVDKRFPKRWRGDFTLNSLGIRFWDENADNETGCQIKPDGMLCFTGNVPFMKWTEIFGPEWVNEQRALNLGKAAGTIYFDGRRYWDMCGGKWADVAREDTITELKTRGISGKASKGQTASDVERVLNFIQKTNRIDGAAPLINYRPGIVEIHGNTILNTYRHRALEPAAGAKGDPSEFPWIWRIINSLFDPSAPYVLDYWLGWLQRFYRAQYNFERTFGQAIFIAGPRESGKSVLAEHVIRPLVGGAMSDPYELFMGKTTFSDDVCSSPLLLVDDKDSPVTESEKRAFLFSVKSWVVSPSHTYHPKFNKKISLPWNGRLIVTCNDDQSSVGILIEVSHNTADKTMYFGTRAFPEPWPDRNENEARIAKELPYFAKFLLTQYTPPPQIVVGGRMGIKSFHDERILRLSQQQIHAYNLTELLTQWCRMPSDHWDENTVWIGSPTALLQVIGTHFDTLVREWTVNKIAHALAIFSSRTGSGITPMAGGREYRIDREVILKSSETEHVPTT